MRFAYDSSVDAAYLTVGGEIGPGEVARTIELAPVAEGSFINVDLDVNGKILGFEILGASVVLREDVISSLSQE